MNDSAYLRERIEQHILSLALGSKVPERLYHPMSYILSLKAKRMRPILTLLAYQSVSGNPLERALNLACGLELFHNFTLMHDDIMDRAPMRRGKASVHKVWDENVAILSGDALFAYSIGLISTDFPSVAHELMASYAQVSLTVCEGQQEDMDLAEQDRVEIADYVGMIRKKTAALLGACMGMGALAGGAEEPLVERFRMFGEEAGLAFQLQDDLMDAFPPQNFGKQVGGDIREKKKTYLYLKALELAEPEMRLELEKRYLAEDLTGDKVDWVLQVFEELGIKSHTEALIQQYFDSARIIGNEIASQVDFEPIKTYLQEISKRSW